MFHNSSNKIYEDNLYKSNFYVNITLVKINQNLSIKFFNRTSDSKTAQNLIPRKTLFVGNLSTKTLEENLYELFGLRNKHNFEATVV